MKRIRLFLVDDERHVRQGLRMRLGMEPDIVVVGEAADGASAIDQIPATQPDVVLMDVNLPGLDGIAAAARLRDVSPGCAVVMLSMHDDSRTRERARLAGAHEFVGKHDIDTALTSAIRAAASAASGDPREGGAD
jgi:DNA-binding NarL/FixJ family response regulator